MAKSYQLFNPVEGDKLVSAVIFNRTQETKHPIEPAVYIQLQAEATFGVRLSASRLSDILVQFYGYGVTSESYAVDIIDVKQAREDADADGVYGNDALERHGLFAAIRQSIPCDVVTVSERLAEVS